MRTGVLEMAVRWVAGFELTASGAAAGGMIPAMSPANVSARVLLREPIRKAADSMKVH